VLRIDALSEARKLGNTKAFNTIVLGMAAKHMDFSKEDWLKVIENTVPPKTVELNKQAFLVGYEM
jgi:indolepyruvate ferredoxin oxidoreductase beta subunit